MFIHWEWMICEGWYTKTPKQTIFNSEYIKFSDNSCDPMVPGKIGGRDLRMTEM
jgi:hypothetical protein